MKIRIGSRGSDLALWQARHVQGLLREKAGVESDITIIHTKGDNLQNVSFNQIEGKGFFTKEIEEALLAGQIDLAVHSLKDLPTEMTPGLEVAAFSDREDPRDILLIHAGAVDESQNPPMIRGARVGTSSNRRKKQIANLRPDVQVVEVRGNVPTRLRKLASRDFDALIMAHAGLKRLDLDLTPFRTVVFDPTRFIPNPAQGILGLQIRSGDAATAEAVRRLNVGRSEAIVRAERGLLARMQGGCQLALGAYAFEEKGIYRYYAFWDELNGRPSHAFNGESSDPERLAVDAYYAFMKAARRLENTTVMLTRPEHQADEWKTALEEFGANVISFPTIRIVPEVNQDDMSGVVRELSQWNWILFTSSNSVDIFTSQLDVHKARIATTTRVAAIGKSTEAALIAKGLTVDFVPSKSNAKDLAVEWLDHTTPSGHVLIPCAHKADDTLEKHLAAHGLKVRRLNLYHTQLPDKHDLPAMDRDPDYLVFASPSAFEYFLEIAALPKTTRMISIGPKTSERIRASGAVVFAEASEPSIEGVILKMLNPNF